MDGFHGIPPGRKRNAAPCGAPQRRGARFSVWLGCLLLLAFPALADTFQAQVVGITDGDTVTVLAEGKREEKVRLSGIDCPEKKQPFGEKAKQSLSDLLFGKTARVEWSKRDRYGRVVGQVFVSPPCQSEPCPSLDAGLAQIRSGLAWHFKRYEKEQTPQDREAYARAEEKARGQKLGLWSESDPVPPWEWRHR